MNNEIPTHACRRATRPMRLDGTLTDPEWDRAEPIKLVRVESGLTPRYATTARLLWDDDHLYIAFVCEDPDIWGTIHERDGNLYKEEVVEVFIDTDSNGTDYYEFEVSPHNVLLDLLIEWRDGKMRGDRTWDCEGWRTAVRVEGTLDDRTDTDTRWTVEMAIPWKSLAKLPHTPPQPGDRLRINLYRIDRAADGDEYSAWSPTGAINYHRPQRFGQLVMVGD